MAMIKTFICELCEKTFNRSGANQKYCSGCRKEGYLKHQRGKSKRWYHNNLERAKKYRREHYQKNKKKEKDKAKRFTHNRKLKVYSAYGGPICSMCKIDDIDVLTIDHINCGGTKHRQELSGTKKYDGQSIYRWLIKENFPEGFRVLCRNCNWKEHLRLNFGN